MNPMKRHISTLLLILLTLVTAQSRTDADSEIVESPTFLIPKDITKDVNYGYREAKRSAADIDVIVIHSCYYAQADSFSTEGCISQFRQHNVSPHYIISRNGEIIKMVEEHNIAQHAGRSMLPGVGRTHLNDSSIGIEIVNTRTEGPNYIQYNALSRLVKDICMRNRIRYIVGHSDIAPTRKDDPWCFDWQRFSNHIHQSMAYIEFPAVNENLMAHNAN